MNNLSKQKLASLGALNVAFLAVMPQAKGQVIYNNLDVDVPVSSWGWGTLPLDLDLDGSDDFLVQNEHWCSPGFDTYSGNFEGTNGNNLSLIHI